MKQHENTDHDHEMRQRFAEQTTRFWRESKKYDEPGPLCRQEVHTVERPKNDQDKPAGYQGT